jgi:hypothetical protein
MFQQSTTANLIYQTENRWQDSPLGSHEVRTTPHSFHTAVGGAFFCASVYPESPNQIQVSQSS